MISENKKMTHIVSYSGGLGSFATAYRIVQQVGADTTRLVFADTKTEDEDLYRFLGETSEFLGCNLTTIEDGRDIWGVFNDVKFMGNNRIDPCSKHLKRDLFKKWMKENYSPDECILYVGIGWNEEHRLERIKKNWEPYKVEAPMTEPPLWENPDTVDILKKWGIEPPRLYALGFAHNNCGGFCVKSGQAQFKLLLKNFPERYRQHEREQELLFKKIGKHGFIRITRKGVMRYLSLKDFREHLECGGEVDDYDYGGCGCFV